MTDLIGPVVFPPLILTMGIVAEAMLGFQIWQTRGAELSSDLWFIVLFVYMALASPSLIRRTIDNFR